MHSPGVKQKCVDLGVCKNVRRDLVSRVLRNFVFAPNNRVPDFAGLVFSLIIGL